jgi:hypothetical protein
MTLRSHIRRHTTLSISAAALLLAGVGAGTGWALTSRASSGAVVPPSKANMLRAEFTARLAALGKSASAPAASSSFNTLRAGIGLRTWSFSTYRNESGQQCMLEVVPGEGQGWGCQDRATMFAKGPLFVSWGSAQAPGPASDRAHWDAAWVEGFAVAPVASVELVLANCAVIPLQLGSDGAFLGVVGREAMHGNSSPYLVRGRDTSGAVVARTVVKLGPISAKSGNIGHPTAPQAAAACR